MFAIIIVYGFVCTTFNRSFPPMLIAVPALVFCGSSAAGVIFSCCRSRIDYVSILGLESDLKDGQGTLYYTMLRDSLALMSLMFFLTNHFLLAAFEMIDQHFLGIGFWTMSLDPLVAAVLLSTILLCPLDFFHRKARVAFFWGGVGLFTSLGGVPHYSLILFADCLTSLGQVMHWLMHSFCSCAKLFEADQQELCFTHPPAYNGTHPHFVADDMCWCNSGLIHRPYGCIQADPVLLPLCFALPPLIRFIQCLHVASRSRRGKHWLNVARYFSILIAVLCSSLGGSPRALLGCIGQDSSCDDSLQRAWRDAWVVASVVSVLLIFVCDVGVDWGVFVERAEGGMEMRTELMLSPQKVYYTAMALDLVAIPGHVLLLAPYQDTVKAWFVPFFVVLEILRRAQWIFMSLEYRMVSEDGTKLLPDTLRRSSLAKSMISSNGVKNMMKSEGLLA